MFVAVPAVLSMAPGMKIVLPAAGKKLPSGMVTGGTASSNFPTTPLGLVKDFV